jgi:hypothetical protein
VSIKSDRTIYHLVENYLRKAKHPQTCVQLMEDADIRQEALDDFGDDLQIATNKLSDVVGHMWRRGLLTRFPAPKTSTSFARYAYMLSEQKPEESSPIPPSVKLKTKSIVGIVEHDDCVEIEFEKFVIYVKVKK